MLGDGNMQMWYYRRYDSSNHCFRHNVNFIVPLKDSICNCVNVDNSLQVLI